jgi:REP element-mobilizing transposase RayT
MYADEPIAFFVTWTVYGTHLQGDELGWRRRRHGEQPPRPRLVNWRRERLKHAIIILSSEQRALVEQEIIRHCEHRSWHIWSVNARTTHIHVVLTAVGFAGSTVRDQLKANGTRGLRELWPKFRDRPVWSVGGDWQCINSDDELEQACHYVREAQDMPRD